MPDATSNVEGFLSVGLYTIAWFIREAVTEVRREFSENEKTISAASAGVGGGNCGIGDGAAAEADSFFI
jgi:hypothetical protein